MLMSRHKSFVSLMGFLEAIIDYVFNFSFLFLKFGSLEVSTCLQRSWVTCLIYIFVILNEILCIHRLTICKALIPAIIQVFILPSVVLLFGLCLQSNCLLLVFTCQLQGRFRRLHKLKNLTFNSLLLTVFPVLHL